MYAGAFNITINYNYSFFTFQPTITMSYCLYKNSIKHIDQIKLRTCMSFTSAIISG